MPDLKRLGRDPADYEQPSQFYGCTVNRAPATAADPLTVVLDAFGDQHETTVTCWMPRGATLPAAGDRGYAALADDGEWLLVSWRPA